MCKRYWIESWPVLAWSVLSVFKPSKPFMNARTVPWNESQLLAGLPSWIPPVCSYSNLLQPRHILFILQERCNTLNSVDDCMAASDLLNLYWNILKFLFKARTWRYQGPRCRTRYLQWETIQRGYHICNRSSRLFQPSYLCIYCSAYI